MSAAVTLLAELRHANTIIKAMLNAMTAQQKARVAEKLEADGVVTDGMSRHHERRAAIETATSGSAAASAKPVTAGEIEDALEIAHIRVEALGALLRGIAAMTDSRDIKTLCKHGSGQAGEVANDLDLLRDDVATAGVAGEKA